MKYLGAVLFLFTSILVCSQTNLEKPNTLLIHSGETVYATFEQAATTLKLLRVSLEENQSAQVVMNMAPFSEDIGIVLKVENRFDRDLTYKAEMRLLTTNQRQDTSVISIRAGKMSFEQWPFMIEELALHGFEPEAR